MTAESQRTVVRVLAGAQLDLALFEARCRAQVRAAGTAEVAHIGVIGPLLVGQRIDRLGDDEIQVSVALAVGAHIHRHAVDIGGKIGAVVQIEAAQEVLVRLAGAAVLGHHHARHQLHHIAGAQQRAQRDLLLADKAL